VSGGQDSGSVAATLPLRTAAGDWDGQEAWATYL
jgi:hypothetical protein